MTVTDQQTLAELQAVLASRRSILHFAHFTVATVIALIGAGTASKLLWDLTKKPQLEVYVAPVAVVSALLLIYGFVRYLYGRSALKIEMVQFGQLKSLRHKLHLDDPSTLLPQ